MIIQCDQCSTRFRLDDAKLSRGSAKVRCSKCKHVFIVPQDEATTEAVPTPEPQSEPAAESSSIQFDSYEATAGESFIPAGQSDEEETTGFNESEPDREQFAEQGIGFQDFAFDETPESDAGAGEVIGAPSVPDEFDLSTGGQADEADFGDVAEDTGDQVAPADDESFNFDDFSASNESVVESPQVRTAPTVAATDDFAIDFGELANPDEASALHGTAAASAAVGERDDLLAESLGLGKDAADVSAAGVQETTVDDFELSFGADLLDFGGVVQAGPDEKSPAQEMADFGELDFGEFVTPEAPASEVVKTPQPVSAETPKAPESLAFQSEEESIPAAVVQADDELPPLSIPSRRKSSALFPVTVIGGAVVLIVALAGYGLYFLNGPNSFTKLIAGVGGSAEEEGGVSIRQVTGLFLRNKEAGEIFIVKGEAVNGFKKPRASIQVKANVYGANGQPLESKTAYCGNNITNEQLASLPVAKIEEAMNNQFGDSLANLGVHPGKAIPFVVVFTKVPKEAVDYGVQVVGSTVAAQ